MAAISWDKNQPQLLGEGVAPIIYGGIEANSQSFKAGALVYPNAGAITAVADDGTEILGIAMKDATNVTSGNIEIPVQIVLPGQIYKMRVSNAGTAALASTATFLGAYGIDINSDGVATMDVAETTADAVVYLGPVLDENGDVGYWAYVSFKNTVCMAVVGE